MEVFPKFIVEGETLIFAKVTYHKELAEIAGRVKGGGFFRFDNEKHLIVFSGTSHDFGTATLADIKKCFETGEIYSDCFRYRNVAKKYNFAFDNGTELISLNQFLK